MSYRIPARAQEALARDCRKQTNPGTRLYPRARGAKPAGGPRNYAFAEMAAAQGKGERRGE